MLPVKLLKKKIVNFMFDHPVAKGISKHTIYIIITIISAFIFSFGFKAFINPNYTVLSNYDPTNETIIVALASCGGSGLSQTLVKICALCNFTWLSDATNREIMFWVFYFAINIPLMIFSWFKLGKLFTLYTGLNVVFVTLFGILIPNSSADDFINQIANYVFLEPVARVLFSSVTTGVAASLAYLIDSTAGGIDILAFYFGEKKSRQVGFYTASLNLIIIIIYCVISTCSGGIILPSGSSQNSNALVAIAPSLALIMVLYTGFYMILNALVVNIINVHNKKECVQIITDNINLSQAILANIPHGCTIFEGVGGYSGGKKYLIYMTVRKNEAKKVIRICQEADNKCFINEFPLSQVYGRFFRKPIE